MNNGEFFSSQRLIKLAVWMLAVGLFIQISGKVWIESGSARNTQVYIWLLLPAVGLFLYSVVFIKRFNISWHYIPWVLFLIWCGVSAFWAVGAEKSAISLAKRVVFIGLFLISIFLFMRLDEPLLKKTLLLSIIVVAIGALLSLIHQYGILGKPLGYRAYRIDRLGIGDFANYGWPVAAGIFNGSVAIWAVGVALDKKTTVRNFCCWGLVFLLLSLYVLMTATRGAWFSLVGGVVASVFMNNSRRGWCCLALSLVVLISLLFTYWPQLIDEFQNKKLSGRGPIWEYYFDVMVGKWWLGYGLGTPFEYRWPDGVMVSPHAHSLYLQQIYDSGIVSLLLFVAGFLVITYKAWTMRNNYWVRMAVPVLIFALIAMITDVERIITRPGDYWTVVWLPIAILLAVPLRMSKT